MEKQSVILMYRKYAAPLYGTILQWGTTEKDAENILEQTFLEISKSSNELSHKNF